MAQTSYIDIAPELQDSFFSNVQPGDRFNYSRVVRKNVLQSKKRKVSVAGRSLFSTIAIAWATLTTGQKSDWSDAGDKVNLTGWQLFVQDYAARLAYGLSGVATPSLLHQSYVGQIHIESPATEAKLVQVHPRNYYVREKVLGTKSQYSPVLVTEDFALPLNLSINYSSDLTASGADPYAKFYADVWYTYQGVNRHELVEIDLDLSTGWTNLTAVLSSITSYVISYDLYIHLHDLRGDLYFDNVEAVHSGQNWVRDPFCKDINEGFSRNFYQVPKHWVASIAPAGVEFESIYKDF